MLIPSPADPISNIYVDESSQTKHRYLVLGGIIIPQPDVAEFEAAIADARLPELPHGELKWAKASRAKLPAYKRVVDTFFDRATERNLPHFHCLVVDTTQIDDRRFNDGSREIGFSKEIYQLLLKFRRLYRDPLFHVYPDRRPTKSDPEDLRLIVNRGCDLQGDPRTAPFRLIHPRDSKAEPILQLTDILIGALAYHLNGHHERDGASPARIGLSSHILNRSPIIRVHWDTRDRGRFTVWHRRLRK